MTEGLWWNAKYVCVGISEEFGGRGCIDKEEQGLNFAFSWTDICPTVEYIL